MYLDKKSMKKTLQILFVNDKTTLTLYNTMCIYYTICIFFKSENLNTNTIKNMFVQHMIESNLMNVMRIDIYKLDCLHNTYTVHEAYFSFE